MLLALIASGCTTEDGLDYDVPARSEVQSADLEIDSDGTPVVLAEINMNYGTRGKRGQWDAKYRSVNVQTVAFTEQDGAWRRHSFRNLQAEYFYGSFLSRNKEGHVQPLVWNRSRLSLYARSGEDWRVRSNVDLGSMDDPLRQAISYASGGNYGFKPLLLQGDSAWQALAIDNHGESFLASSTGDRLTLDSNAYNRLVGFFYGVKENHLIATRYLSTQNQDGSPNFELVCYSWNPGPGDPHLRRRKLLDSAEALRMTTMNIQGEFHAAIGNPTVIHTEIVLRGDDFIRREDVPPTAESGGSAQTISNPFGYSLVTSQSAPDGCVHSLFMSRDSGTYSGGEAAPIPFFVHEASCSEGADTLPLPATVQKSLQNFGSIKMRFSKEGKPLVVIAGRTPVMWNGTPDQDYEIGPSGIYLARWTGPGKWAVDTIAEY